MSPWGLGHAPPEGPGTGLLSFHLSMGETEYQQHVGGESLHEDPDGLQTIDRPPLVKLWPACLRPLSKDQAICKYTNWQYEVSIIVRR